MRLIKIARKYIISLLIGLFFCSVCAAQKPYLQIGVFIGRNNAEKTLLDIKTKTTLPSAIIVNDNLAEPHYYVVIMGFKHKADAIEEKRRIARLYQIKAVLKLSDTVNLYRWTKQPELEAIEVESAHERLEKALIDPEFMLDNWVGLPIAPETNKKKTYHLSLKDAILLTLRYNPNIQNEELDRITQRYDLRLAYNKFELQYALEGSVAYQKTTAQGITTPGNQNYIVSPSLNLETLLGTTFNVNINNNYDSFYTYNPVLSVELNQPLLRGFGSAINGAPLLNAIDNDAINKYRLNQNIISQITTVITQYHGVIANANNLISQKQQLKEAEKTFQTNKKKIEAGKLEPTGNIQQGYQVETIRGAMIDSENALKTSMQVLLQAIGLDPKMNIRVPSDVALNDIEIPNLKESIDYALSHNTDYITQVLRVKQDERAYKVQLNQQLWELNLQAGTTFGSPTGVVLGSSTSNPFDGRNVTSSINLKLKVPIHDLQRKSGLINAKITLEKDKIALAKAKRELITKVKNSIITIQARVRRYKLAKKQVALARQSFAIEQKKQSAGIATLIDVKTTQDQLLSSQRSLINAKIDYLDQIAQLNSILGTTLEKWGVKVRYTG
jgi:outer membrane protein